MWIPTTLMLGFASFFLCVATGCDRDANSAAIKTSDATPEVQGKGIIRGRVLFGGNPSQEQRFPVNASADCARLHRNGITDESVVINQNGTLRNVVVHVQTSVASDGRNREAVLLDQVSCQYVPHVVALQVGQTLRVRSSDPFLHNVSLMCSENPAKNFAFPNQGSRDLQFAAPEIFKTRCDVHPWMSAWVCVFADRCFAVTDDKGEFKMEGVPAGAHTLVAWHERLGEMTQTVTIVDARPVDVDFTYKP